MGSEWGGARATGSSTSSRICPLPLKEKPMSNNKQLVLDFYKAFDTKGVEAAAAYLASNFKTEVPGTPGTLDINGYRQFMTMFKTAFPDVYHVFENTVAEGDMVVTIGYFAGTHT